MSVCAGCLTSTHPPPILTHTIPSLLSSVLQTPPPCDLSPRCMHPCSPQAPQSHSVPIYTVTHIVPPSLKARPPPSYLISSQAWAQVISNTVHSPQSFHSILIPSTLPPFSSSSQLLIKARMSCVFTNSFLQRAREVDRPPRRQRSAHALSYRKTHSERRPAIAVAVRVNQRNCFIHRPTACLFVFLATGLHAAPTP